MSQREAIDISFPLLLGRLDVICCNVFLGKQDDSKSLGRSQLRKHDRVGESASCLISAPSMRPTHSILNTFSSGASVFSASTR